MSSRPPFLIPVRSYRARKGVFTWPQKTTISTPRDADLIPIQQLSQTLKQQLKVSSKTVLSAAGNSDITITRDPDIKHNEGYRLEISTTEIRIMASGNAGVYYAIQTLRELIKSEGSQLQACRIDDYPQFERRGVYYDAARGKVPTIETLKELIEWLASLKINEFQIYIKNAFSWKAHPAIGRGFSPYKPQDLLEIQAHCKLHHINFVPSIATLSHSELTLQLPQYRHLAELPGSNGWEGGTMLCPTDPKSFKFTTELHREFLPLFESVDVNLCCDEPWELGRGRSKRTADKIGRGQVYLNFLLKLHRNCQKLGKRMNVWGDIILKYPELINQLPKDIVMLNWDYNAQGANIPRTGEFVDAGLSVIACPGTSGWQRHGTDLPNAMANVSNFAGTAAKHNITGILNTDWGDFGHRNTMGVSLHGYAHGAAHAWHTKGVDNESFTERFALHTFADIQRMPDTIKILGECASLACHDSRCLYHALVEPLQPPVTRFIKKFRRTTIAAHYPQNFPNFIDKANPKALHTISELLSQENLLPDSNTKLSSFARHALADYKLAISMDLLAVQHAALGQSQRAHKKTPTAELTKWADAMHNLSANFEKNWLLRFRPSRLADNLKIMRLAENEARQLGM